MKTRGEGAATSYRIVMSLAAVIRMGAMVLVLPLADWKGQGRRRGEHSINGEKY